MWQSTRVMRQGANVATSSIKTHCNSLKHNSTLHCTFYSSLSLLMRQSATRFYKFTELHDTRFATCTFRRGVHEQPFLELPPDVSKNEAYEAARDALLQLNIMIRRGIEPDALMYTTLIATMGKAQLEWQAYKLFSRMIEQNIRPLPETYVALYEATSSKREKLRAHIQAKIEDAIESLPEQLAQEELARRKEEDRWCVLKFEEYMKGELPQLPNEKQIEYKQENEQQELESEPEHEHKKLENTESKMSEPVATMQIRNPTDAWRVAELAESQRETRRGLATASARDELCNSLYRLHEEELRIYLAIHRQLRHGSKEQLVARIVASISETSIRSMLARRAHYFRSVGDILEADLEKLKMYRYDDKSNKDSKQMDEQEEQNVKQWQQEEELEQEEEEEEEEEREQENDKKSVTSSTEKNNLKEDETLSNGDDKSIAPQVLYTPWGILRKPLHAQAITAFAEGTHNTFTRNAARLEQIRLSADELLLIRHKAEVKELDELPESLLRRYAYQFQLHWRRRELLSLHNAVEWHVIHFCTSNLLNKGNAEKGNLSSSSSSSLLSTSESSLNNDDNITMGATPTPAIRLQMEDEGMKRSMENYEAFRIIAQRTNNLQVVDHREINAHLRKVEQRTWENEQRAADALRRETNILNAASLAKSARSFTPPMQSSSLSEEEEEEEELISNHKLAISPNEEQKMELGNIPQHVLGVEEGIDETRKVHSLESMELSEEEEEEEEVLENTANIDVEHNRYSEYDKNSGNTKDNSVNNNANKELRVLQEEEEEQEEYREQEVNELPPWAIFGEEDEFNLTTGRFGNPELGRYRELSDSHIRVLPSQSAQQKWSVDRQLLPLSVRDVVHELELVQQRRRDAIEEEYHTKLQYTRYRKWDNLIQRANEKKAKLKENNDNNNNNSSNHEFASKPLPLKKRYSQLLRAGVERQRMSERDLAKYNKSL